jgi:Zn-dependent protease with chaperone function
MRFSLVGFVAVVFAAAGAGAAELSGVVHKPTAEVHAQPKFESPKVATLNQGTPVKVSAQQGMWYELQMPAGTTGAQAGAPGAQAGAPGAQAGAPGYVRVDDVRINYGGASDGDANMRILMGGKPGQGRITETAGVRGIDESDLKSVAFNQAQLNAMVGNRVDAATAAAYAGKQGWTATTVAYAGEAKPGTTSIATTALQTASSQEAANQLANTPLGGISKTLGGMFGGKKAKVVPKTEEELAAEELALGPQIAGRLLGTRPLWVKPEAQQRVNRVGEWVAAQTSRPDLPWTFGVIDTAEINAFAAPGGYILVTRGLYELLISDEELAAVLGHEISHCVQRDHYNVIRKQELATAGKDVVLQDVAGNSATSAAAANVKRYVDEYGATIMLTALDRGAEYHADEAAEYYLARAGMNPIALYAVLQKMAALGNESAALAQLYKTHPPLDARMDRIDARGYGALEIYTTRD